MNRSEAGRLVAVLVSAYPQQGAKLDAERVRLMIDTFAALLGDLGYEQANAALTVLIQTRTWMPSVAEIRGAALELARGAVRPGGEAWGGVLRAIAAEGAYRSPGSDFAFADPITAHCVAALGWQNLCSSENPVADRARFIELYDQTAAQSRRDLQSPALAAAKEQRRIDRANPAAVLVDGVARRLQGGES